MAAILRRLSALQSRVRKNFLGGVSDEPLLSKTEMLDAPPQPETRRHLLDGGYTVALLAIAIAAGYGILGSTPAPAKSARPDAPASAVVGAVVTPPVEAPPASIPDTSRAPETITPAAPTVALARPPAVTPEPPRPTPEVRPRPAPAPRPVK